MAGGRDLRTFELASDVDYVRGMHTVRTGFLLDGGTYRSDESSNYLGTYVFTSTAFSFNDRPVGVGRDTARLPWRSTLSASLSYFVGSKAQWPGREAAEAATVNASAAPVVREV